MMIMNFYQLKHLQKVLRHILTQQLLIGYLVVYQQHIIQEQQQQIPLIINGLFLDLIKIVILLVKI